MTRTLSNESVELELGSGEWSARWVDCEIVLGPCRADVDCLEWETDPRHGAWHIETTRRGARARWTHADDTAWVELRLGNVHDLRGDRQAAQAWYQGVTGDEQAETRAHAYMATPFTPVQIDLKPLEQAAI